MTKDWYTIPTTTISFVINVILLFKVVESSTAIEYVFCIFVSVSYSFLTYRLLVVVSNYFLIYFSFLMGSGVFLYARPFPLMTEIYLAVEIVFLIAFQNDISSSKCEKEIMKIETQKDATELQRSVIKDLKNGIDNKDICKKYDLKPYQVTRIKQKYL